MIEFKQWLESVFDQESDYWLNKKSVPSKLGSAIEPYTNRGLRVLDLGCGGGRMAASLLPGFKNVHGFDSSAELLQKAKIQNPNIQFKCGNFQLPQTWKGIEAFDVIVSNCAIRKDYCSDLARVATLCHEHLSDHGVMILRIQALEDLKSILPEELRRSLFYDNNEIKEALSSFSSIKLDHETYRQKFSSEHYIRTFLERINIHYSGPIKELNPIRHYYIVKAIK